MLVNHFKLAVLPALLLGAVQTQAATLCAAGTPNATSVVEATPTSAFVNHGDGTVTHGPTGLMWKQCIQGLSGAGCGIGTATVLGWSGALASAVADTTAGHHDWRAPNKKELDSIIESCGYGPAFNQAVFPATSSAYLWTSTTFAHDPTMAWDVHAWDGAFDVGSKASGLAYVRLVRGGASVGSFDANHPQSTIDIDGDGKAGALTDGLLMLRYLFGLRGAPLTAGAVDAAATRKTAAEIETYIQSLLPQ